MTMSKRTETDRRRLAGTVLIVLGFLVIAGAGLLYSRVVRDERQAQAAAQAAVEALASYFEEEQGQDPVVVTQEPVPMEESPEESPQEPVINIDGTVYLGLLSFPAFGRELPVFAEFSMGQLRSAPARYTGSIADDNIVIAGHNYRTHFNILPRRALGDEVFFTDAQGDRIPYLVERVETLEATAIEAMTSGDWDMTLFTCTYGGQARVAVRCVRAEPVS